MLVLLGFEVLELDALLIQALLKGVDIVFVDQLGLRRVLLSLYPATGDVHLADMNFALPFVGFGQAGEALMLLFL